MKQQEPVLMRLVCDHVTHAGKRDRTIKAGTVVRVLASRADGFLVTTALKSAPKWGGTFAVKPWEVEAK